MKAFNLLTILVLFCSTAFGVNRGNPREGLENSNTGRRERTEISAKLDGYRMELGRMAREVIGTRLLGESFEIILPKNIAGKEAKYETELNLLFKDLEAGRDKYKEESQDAKDMAHLLRGLNELYSQRSPIADKIASGGLSGKGLESAQEFLKLIDNAATWLSVKSRETTEDPVSARQMMRVMDLVANLKTTRAGNDAFLQLEAQITAILPAGYNLRKAARCIR